MKKTISINISGIVFHIEDDGYDKLRKYLDSINIYFSTFDDSKEIVEDIENRIAEIFSEKLKAEKEVITAEDVDSLIATMGTISDFKAIEEDESKRYDPLNEPKKENTYSAPKSRKLYKDTKKKLLGGVAAGIGNYFEVDAIWIRLIFIAVFFGISFIPALSGFTAVCYIILWIVLPEASVIEEEENIKKFYRDPDDKVISGVCSGLAAYFGVDVMLIRVIFGVGLFLGGSAAILYLVLWAITPEAHTITQKMKMQGEPVTLSNIETNIKKNINLTDDKEETALAKILLFPFRVIAMVFDALGKVLGPLLYTIGDIVRAILGVILVLIPVVLFVSLAFALGIVLGFTDVPYVISSSEFPIETMLTSVPKAAILSVFATLAIPLVFIGLLGSSLLAKRKILHPAFTVSLLGLFVIAIVFTATTLPSVVKDFRRYGKVEEEQNFPIKAKVIRLEADPNAEMEYSEVNLYLRGYQGNELKLVKEFSARGSSKREAMENAKMIDYIVQQKDSTLIFDLNFTFKEQAIFRGQQLDLVLYIPYGQEFLIGDDMSEIVKSNTFHGDHYYYDIEGGKWVFEQDGMRCLDCSEEDEDRFEFDSNKVKGIVEAEDYTSMNGVKIERTHDTGSGENIAYLESGDWAAYKIKIPRDGIYTIRYRVASRDGDGRIRLESLGGGEEFGTISIPQTGDWQTWRTISHTVRLKKEQTEIVLMFEEGGFNLNWFSITLGNTNKDYNEDNADFDFHNDDNDNSGDHKGFSFDLDFDDENDNIRKDTRTLRLTDFTGLSISGMFLINVIRDNEFRVKLTGDEQAINDLDVEVKGNKLNINMDDDKKWNNKKGRTIRVDISMPSLNYVELNGFTKSNIKGFKSDELKVDLNGAAVAEMDVNARNFDLGISGGAKVDLMGKAESANINISGAADFDGFDFIVKNADVDISGASSTKIHAIDYLKIEANGPCDIRYKGKPRIDQDLSMLSHMQHED